MARTRAAGIVMKSCLWSTMIENIKCEHLLEAVDAFLIFKISRILRMNIIIFQAKTALAHLIWQINKIIELLCVDNTVNICYNSHIYFAVKNVKC